MSNKTSEVNFWVIIPAGGIGKRCLSDVPKQYIRVYEQTILEYTLHLFLPLPWVTGIVVPLNAEDQFFEQLELDSQKVFTVEGGTTRSVSVKHALDFLSHKSSPHDWVLTHDAVRPCLHDSDLNHLIESLKGDEVGGILASVVKDTIKKSENNRITQTIDRQNLWHALTPQMFRFHLLAKAYQQCDNIRDLTDDAMAIENLGYAPKIVESTFPNPKLTYSQDLSFMAMLLKNRKELSCA